MASKISPFKKLFQLSWYTQGINAVPVFLNAAALSGMTMKTKLGFGYKHFLFYYKNGYGEMNYDTADIERIWKIVRVKLSRNPRYLVKTKQLYDRIFKKFLVLFERLDKTDFKSFKDQQLLKLFRECATAQVECVGVGHVLDATGIALEDEFKKKLSDQISEKNKLDEYFASLATPSKPSFFKREELELAKIGRLKGARRKKALIKHRQKYFWLRNNYTGPHRLNTQYFANRLKTLKTYSQEEKLTRKNRLIRQLRLPRKITSIIKLVDFATLWQDDRKINILKSIFYFDSVLREISKRTKIPLRYLHYLEGSEAVNARSLNSFINLKPELKRRSRGCLYYMSAQEEIAAGGKAFTRLAALYKNALHSVASHAKEIRGSVASPGKVKGRVIICNSLQTLKQVKLGDILVTSMTRPEFMPALKKASGIITNEGGVTSHAAIVSRELGVPCIIGTKIATKVLKTGQLVELDANRGIVKVIAK